MVGETGTLMGSAAQQLERLFVAGQTLDAPDMAGAASEAASDLGMVEPLSTKLEDPAL